MTQPVLFDRVNAELAEDAPTPAPDRWTIHRDAEGLPEAVTVDLPAAEPSAHSYTQAVLEYLTARPGEAVDGLVLARIGGAYAWRSRVSNARTILEDAGRGTITNTLIRTPGKPTVSRYTFIPTRIDTRETA